MKQTLYASRNLLNGDEFVQWAESQGFEDVSIPDLHVTIAYSRKEVDWGKITPDEKGLKVLMGTRSVVRLGDEGAVVLKFKSFALEDRWKELCDAGASWDYEGYQSHVTITYDSKNLDLSKVMPYYGPLVFGGEVFKPLDLDWKPKTSK